MKLRVESGKLRVLLVAFIVAAVVRCYAQDNRQAAYPDNLVPYHVHADLVAVISNLAERVTVLEAREKRIQAAREAARKRAAANVPRKKKINELNAKLKSRYPVKEAK